MCIICELKKQQQHNETTQEAGEEAFASSLLEHILSNLEAQEDPEEAEEILAPEFLQKAFDHMQDRAATYDAPDGERSMGKTVEAFNTLTGFGLTEEQGWMFMALLKMARSTQGDLKLDNYEDLVAYSALMGEAAAQGK